MACKADLSQVLTHVDHIVALANGGRHEMTNLQLLCRLCNQQKHTKDFGEFLALKGYA